MEGALLSLKRLLFSLHCSPQKLVFQGTQQRSMQFSAECERSVRRSASASAAFPLPSLPPVHTPFWKFRSLSLKSSFDILFSSLVHAGSSSTFRLILEFDIRLLFATNPATHARKFCGPRQMSQGKYCIPSTDLAKCHSACHLATCLQLFFCLNLSSVLSLLPNSMHLQWNISLSSMRVSHTQDDMS